MADENLTVPAGADDLGSEEVVVEAELVDEDAECEIGKAVRGRRGIARRYVRWVRRQNPDATPAEIISMLEHHYVTAISAAGTAITVGGIAAEVGISLIPGGGAAASGTKAVAKEAGKRAAKHVTREAVKQTTKTAAKSAALGAARGAAARFIPAGDKQLQFEITALFALAVADIHGWELDQEQAHALVLGLSNERVSQQQIAAMAGDLAQSAELEVAGASPAAADGRKGLEHWASTLADSLPGGAAQNLVRGMQTGVLDDFVGGLDARKQTAVEYGAGAVVGGVTRFVFGRKVVDASHSAFPDAPDAFPPYLEVPVKPEQADDEENRALGALTGAAKAVGAGVGTRAAAVGTGVASAAGTATRAFRSVDLDGDGVPDEPQALTAVKDVGGAIAGAAGTVGGSLSGLFKSKKHGRLLTSESPRELEAEDSDSQGNDSTD